MKMPQTIEIWGLNVKWVRINWRSVGQSVDQTQFDEILIYLLIIKIQTN